MLFVDDDLMLLKAVWKIKRVQPGWDVQEAAVAAALVLMTSHDFDLIFCRSVHEQYGEAAPWDQYCRCS
jgi:hypothetical protein